MPSVPSSQPLSDRPVGRLSRRFLARATSTAVGAVAVTTALAGVLGAGAPAPDVAPAPADVRPVAASANPVTPGNLTGYGFDQCLAPDQDAMTAWMNTSPFLAVGIYIAGDSRGCRNQPNLTPTWIRTQLAAGWRLLPITLGRQSSCNGSFPRYSDDTTISTKRDSRGRYATAARQAALEVEDTLAVAERLGLRVGSTLFYDLEAFDTSRTACREAALTFLSAWTQGVHEAGWKSGVYSSAGSVIKALDDARVKRPGTYVMPDTIWMARWDEKADTSSSYVREDGWRPGGRIKQYRGDHRETWGGVTINIDSNYLDVGRGSKASTSPKHCGGAVAVDHAAYPALKPGNAAAEDADLVTTLQCLLKERRYYSGELTGTYDSATRAAAQRYQTNRDMTVSTTWSTTHWMRLLTEGRTAVVKVGSTGEVVRRLQRALAAPGTRTVKVEGFFSTATRTAVRGWQKDVGLPVTGVVDARSWSYLARGRR